MNFKTRMRALAGGTFLAALVAITPATTGSGIAHAQELDKAAVEKIIKEYLIANPEILLDMQDALKAKQDALRLAQQAQTLEDKKEQIYNSDHHMIIGDPDAKVTVVEFFDYNCGYCKRALDDMNRIVSENPDVKFVMKEFPVLGEGSVQAHQVSLALVHLYPELYADFHRQLLSAEGHKDGQAALDVAASLGADPEKLKIQMEDTRTMEAFKEVYDIADGLGISGTPSYVVGDEVIFGAVGYSRLMPKVANLKECGKASC